MENKKGKGGKFKSLIEESKIEEVPTDFGAWLNESPAPEEIKVKDGAKYIPYDIIIQKLYILCGHNWGVPSFNETYVTIGKLRKVVVSGNVTIEVNYIIDGAPVKRILAGGANFVLNKSGNPHPTATAKSLAIMNAVKPLGKQFGWQLNDDIETMQVGEDIDDETAEVDANILKELEEFKAKLADMDYATALKTLQSSASWKLNKDLREFVEKKK